MKRIEDGSPIPDDIDPAVHMRQNAIRQFTLAKSRPARGRRLRGRHVIAETDVFGGRIRTCFTEPRFGYPR